MGDTTKHNDDREEKRVPAVKRVTRTRAREVDAVDRLLQEINLINLERFLFSTDRKRPTPPSTTLTFNDAAGKVCRITCPLNLLV